MRSDAIVVVGAGMGGLSAAIRLAAAGRRVIVVEANDQPGGKVQEVRRGDYRWDAGPSVITMRGVLADLFAVAGRNLSDYLTLRRVEPYTRYFYPDGSVLDATANLPDMLTQLQRFGAREVEGYLGFLAYAARLHRIVAPIFIYSDPPHLRRLLQVSPGDVLQFDGLRTMQQAIESHVRSSQLRQLLGRFATYVGASPYRAPATLNVIAHVELNEGVWYPAGGVYSIVRALTRLAGEMGVEIRCGTAARAITVQGGAVQGVTLADGTHLPASAVVANVDVATVYRDLLDAAVTPRRREQLLAVEPSCSGLILLLGVRGVHPQLAHHNIFFSRDYAREFADIFERGVPPSEPTIYIAITARSDPADAPADGENWFVLVNAPALGPGWDWATQADSYCDRVLALLAERGLDIRDRIVHRRMVTPVDLEHLTGARRGALYGASSNSRWAAFRRPHNRASEVRGLYFAGGTVHPGGGVPMTLLSGAVASRLLLADGY